jgi:hypothetical protein
MFRLHESLTPHIGLVGAAALVIAGVLLYWLAFARSGIAMHPSELLRISTGWSHETAPQTTGPSAAPSTPTISDEPAHAAGWTAPQRVAHAAPATLETPTAEAHADTLPGPGPALSPPSEAPVPLPPVVEDAPTTTSMNDRGVTPTPVSMCPTTPYPAHSFGARVAGAAMPGEAVVAGQPNRYGTTNGVSR